MTHTSTEQPEALRLAYELEAEHGSETLDDAADMLRRLYARVQELEAERDEAFDDFAEDVDDSECHNCSGTGEGMYDSQSCVVCLGKGFL